MWVQIFAVEDTTAQVCWEGASDRPLAWRAGDTAVVVERPPSAGAVVLEGLPPDTDLELEVAVDGAPFRPAGSLRTLAPPPGRLLSRFATVNDSHLGAVEFGTLHPLRDPGDLPPPPVRCLRAALHEAAAWGAQLLVGKGDLTQSGLPGEWDLLADLLIEAGLPVLLMEGNHDVRRTAVDGATALARRGLTLHRSPGYVDLPGARVMVVPTAPWHRDDGFVDPAHRRLALDLLDGAPGAAVVAMHHYPQRFRWPTMYPSGIPGPAAAPFLDAIAGANPATLVLTGHSHRHRRHAHGPLVVAEVGSTKDYPGSWAGYAVYEGGIRQVTRRVSAPEAMAWTTPGRHVLGGAWGLWAPGVRSHRCFSHTWPDRPAT